MHAGSTRYRTNDIGSCLQRPNDKGLSIGEALGGTTTRRACCSTRSSIIWYYGDALPIARIGRTMNASLALVRRRPGLAALLFVLVIVQFLNFTGFCYRQARYYSDREF